MLIFSSVPLFCGLLLLRHLGREVTDLHANLPLPSATKFEYGREVSLLRIQPTVQSTLSFPASPELRTALNMKQAPKNIHTIINWKYQRLSWNFEYTGPTLWSVQKDGSILRSFFHLPPQFQKLTGFY